MRSKLFLFAFLCFFAAAARAEDITFGIISTEASTALRQQWSPLLADLSAQSGLTVRPFFASDYAGIIEAMRFNKAQIAYFGNKSAMEAVDRAEGEVFAQTVLEDGVSGYYSLLITHRESGITTLNDVLKNPGKFNFANGDPNSTSGFLVPGYYVFAQNHIDPKTHFRRVVSGSHETNIMAVLNKQVDLATNNSMDMEKLGRVMPDRIRDISVIWTSPLLPSDPLVWRKDLDPALKQRIAQFFFAYGHSGNAEQQRREQENLRRLTFSGFRPSNNDQLLPIRQMELFRARARIADDFVLDLATKSAKLQDIDAKLADLQKIIGVAR